MQDRQVEVLVVSESSRWPTLLLSRLESLGCQCRFAKSIKQARALIASQPFDLVLSQMKLRDGSAYALIEPLLGTRATLYCALAVENGSWWVPAVRKGQICLGSPAVRSAEFYQSLDPLVASLAAPPPKAGAQVA